MLGLLLAVLPAVLMVDLIHAWMVGRGLSAPLVTLDGAVLAAAAALCLPAVRRLVPTQGILHTFWQAILVAAVLEAVLWLVPARLLAIAEHSYFLPGSQRVHDADRLGIAGVRGEARFTTNELGLRAPPLTSLAGQPIVYRINCIGGSTTECLFLDDSEAWPQLVMDRLNERRRPPYAYVANAGISGHSTVHHRILLESKKNIHEADALVFLTGVNDLSAAVSNDGRPTQALLEEDASYLQPLLPHYKRLRLYHMARLARRRISRDPGTHDPELYRKRRQLRANKARVPLPNLVGSVKEYRDRLRRLSEYCRQAAKRCIFLTQPTIWKTAADSAEESQLWYGWVGGAFSPRGYVGSGELAQAMAMFNNELLSLCHAARLECYDLASAIPKTRNAFFDDCHFTEAGARMVADFVAGRLAEAAPFSYHSRPRDTLEPDVVGRAAGAGRLDGSRVMPPVPPQPGRPSGY